MDDLVVVVVVVVVVIVEVEDEKWEDEAGGARWRRVWSLS